MSATSIFDSLTFNMSDTWNGEMSILEMLNRVSKYTKLGSDGRRESMKSWKLNWKAFL